MNTFLLALAILVGAGSLHGMESQEQPHHTTLVSPETKLSPITWSQTYHQLSKLLIPEIAQHIFLLQLKASGVNLATLPHEIEQSCKHPKRLVLSIDALITSCGYELASELFERFFTRAKISICDIKDRGEPTPLHYAAHNSNLYITKIVLKIAGSNTWRLLTMKTNNGWTALHLATASGCIEIVNLLIDAAGNNAFTLLTMKDIKGSMAFDFATDEIYSKKQSIITKIIKQTSFL